MLEDNTVAILLFDRNGEIIFANQAAFLIAAGSVQEETCKAVTKKSWGKPFEFDENPVPVSNWPTVLALKGEKTVGKELRMVRPDGSHYDILLSASPLTAEHGEIIGAIVSFIDITERRLAEQELTSINGRMEQLASERARGIHLMHLIGLSAQSIGSIKEMFQIALTEICNQMRWVVGYAYIVEGRRRLHGITLWHSSDAERYEPLRRATQAVDFSRKESIVGQVIKTGKPVFAPIDNESFLRREAALQAGLRSCLAIPVLVHKEPAAVLEFFHSEAIEPQDSVLEVMEIIIGAHLGLTIEQQRTEQKLQALFDSAPDAQIVTDEIGKIVMANKQTVSLFGYSRDELLGQPVELLVPPDLRTRHIQHRADFTARPHPRPMGIGAKLKGIRKDRTEIPVEVSLSPIELDGEFLISSAVRDVNRAEKARTKDERARAAGRHRDGRGYFCP
jgi:PAS domain S-box-containing protein